MTARQQLQKFMAKYDPALAIQAKQALAKLRKLLPGAVEMIYDTYNALVIGFVPGERASQAVFSLALYPQYFNLFFAWGKACQTLESFYKAVATACGAFAGIRLPHWMSLKFANQLRWR